MEVVNRATNPRVAHCLKHCFYVLEFLGGANSEGGAHQLVKGRCSDLGKYQFPLRKWSSKSVSSIPQLQTDIREFPKELELLTNSHEKFIGNHLKTQNGSTLFHCIQRHPPLSEQLNKANSIVSHSTIIRSNEIVDSFIHQFQVLHTTTLASWTPMRRCYAHSFAG